MVLWTPEQRGFHRNRVTSAGGGGWAENVIFHDFLLEHLRKERFNHRGLYSGRQRKEAQAF